MGQVTDWPITEVGSLALHEVLRHALRGIAKSKHEDVVLRQIVAKIHPASIYLLAEIIERARYAGPAPLREGDLVQVTLPAGDTRTEVVGTGESVGDCNCQEYWRCPKGHCSKHYACQDCESCCNCTCNPGPVIELNAGQVVDLVPFPIVPGGRYEPKHKGDPPSRQAGHHHQPKEEQR